MILQPIVENSIKHGLSPKVGGGHDRHPQRPRRAAAPSSRWPTTAIGMSEERLREALHGGIGLSNVNERLRVIYGDNLPAEAAQRARRGSSVRHRDPGRR